MQPNDRRRSIKGELFVQFVVVAILAGALVLSLRPPSAEAKNVQETGVAATHADPLGRVIPYCFFGESLKEVNPHFQGADSILERRSRISETKTRTTVLATWAKGTQSFHGVFENGRLVFAYELSGVEKALDKKSDAMILLVNESNGGMPYGTTYTQNAFHIPGM